MVDIDTAIDRMEQLYRSLTGREAPPRDSASPLPKDKDPAQHVSEQLDHLLEVLEKAPVSLGLVPTWTPRISAWEGPKEALIFIELPGVPPEAIEVVSTRNVLTVTGYRPVPVSNGTRDYHIRALEHPLGAFRRSVTFPAGIQEGIRAEMKNGLLEIRVPKGTKTPPLMQEIPVK
ncbi:MAG: Hsp20/alpha crystallin family protein [Deltaproteobacteria bacterium]|nr:Hsp20/alpha crystallin family protein [Deltaproteobacteria bacterium]